MNRDALAQLTDDEKIDLILTLQAQVDDTRNTPTDPLTNSAYLMYLLSNLPIVIFVIDRDGIVQDFRGKERHTLQSNFQDFVGRSIHDMHFINDDISQAFARTLQGQAFSIRREVSAGNYEFGFYPIKNRAGDVTHVLGHIMDINDLRQAEDALLKSQRYLQALTHHTAHFLALLDTEGRLLEINKASLELGGLQRADVIGAHLWDVKQWRTSHEAREQLIDAIQHAAQGHKRSLTLDVKGPRKHETVVDMSLVPITDDEGKVLMILMDAHDITDTAKAEQMLKNIIEREQRLNESRSRFLTTTSHEFRNPLAIIGSSTYLLNKGYDRMTPERREEHFTLIKDNIDHLAQMLDDIQALAEINEQAKTRRETVDVGTLISQTVHDFHQKYGRVRVFNYKAETPAIRIEAAPALLRQTVQQLLNNAVAYSPEGSLIKVRLTTDETHFHLTVQDEGIGIEPEDLPHLMENFYRGNNIGLIPGNGLGLSIVGDVLALHNGDIHIESEPDEGTTVTVSLPLTND